MIFFEIPAIPVPRFLQRRLRRWRLICPEQADDAPLRGSEAYTLRQSANADREWLDILTSEERELQGLLPERNVVGLPAAAMLRALLRFFNARFVTSFRFFRMTQTLYPSGNRWSLAAPRRLRSRFRERGVMVDEAISVPLWFMCKVVLLTHAALALFRSFVSAIVEGMTAGRAAPRHPIIWLGLSPAELRDAQGGLNALDFVREGRLALFREGAPLFVAAPWQRGPQSVSDVNAILCPNPFRTTRHRISWQELVGLCRDSVAVAKRIISDAFRDDGLFLLLARDYVELPRMRLWFQSVRPRALVITNTMYESHPLWFAVASEFGCEAVMLFYSTNAIPLHVKGEPDPVPGDPAYRLLDCTRFEVWTEGQKRWLVSLGIPADAVHVVGIIIWGRYSGLDRRSSREIPVRDSRDSAVRIGLFDVIPVTRSFWIRRGVGEHYYNAERMVQLLEDVVQLSRELPGPTTIFLKSKRPRHAIHDPVYWDAVERLVAEGKLVVYSQSQSPIEAVAGCDLVISAPFSSPSVIASQMGIPACFYDPAELLRMPPITVSAEIPLISGLDQLRRWMIENVPAPGSEAADGSASEAVFGPRGIRT